MACWEQSPLGDTLPLEPPHPSCEQSLVPVHLPLCSLFPEDGAGAATARATFSLPLTIPWAG